MKKRRLEENLKLLDIKAVCVCNVDWNKGALLPNTIDTIHANLGNSENRDTVEEA
jgi:hypothetical protein